ncbi:MAG: integration host factor subunit alpha [Hydrogenophaga sp.]|nr:integration host factor subunit alpha [Hydrogenophaga sp.]
MQAMSTFVDNLEIPALTKSDLVEMLGEHMGLSGRESCELVEGFFELITNRLLRGEDVKLAGFGNFEVHQKEARPGRNPRTGVSVEIAPRKVVRFSAGPKFMRRMESKTLAEPLSIAKSGPRLPSLEIKPSRRRSARSEEARQPAGI